MPFNNWSSGSATIDPNLVDVNKVPTGYEVMLLEGTTSGGTTDVISVPVPSGKRIIGVSSVLIAFNSGWLTQDTTGSIDWNYFIESATTIKIQGKSSHTQNKPYMITVQLANI